MAGGTCCPGARPEDFDRPGPLHVNRCSETMPWLSFQHALVEPAAPVLLCARAFAHKGGYMGLRFHSFLVLVTLAVMIPAVARTQGQAAASIPRTADGKPDLSGIWQVMNSAAFDIQDHAAQKGVPGGPGVVEGNDIPYQPAALAKKKENYEKRATLDP